MRSIDKSLAAGMMIGIGGAAYLSVTNAALGALLFSVGLAGVVSSQTHLFTGRVCYYPNDTALTLAFTWAFNIIGSILMGLCMRLARPDLIPRALDLVDGKLSNALIQTYMLAMICGALIYLAVDSHSFLVLTLCVMAFILLGAEHCIADAFYLSLSGSWDAFPRLVCIATAGNTVGGILMHMLCIAPTPGGSSSQNES